MRGIPTASMTGKCGEGVVYRNWRCRVDATPLAGPEGA